MVQRHSVAMAWRRKGPRFSLIVGVILLLLVGANAGAQTLNRSVVGFTVTQTGVRADGASPMEKHNEGPLTLVDMDGVAALKLEKRATGNYIYLYVSVDDELIFDGPFSAAITITYMTTEAGRFRVQFDSASGSKTQSSQYLNIGEEQVGQWLTSTIDLPDVRFRNAQNGSGDMRIVAARDVPLYVRAIQISIK